MNVSTHRSHLVLGIMSGTSLDGVDYALCRISSQALRLVDFWHVSFPSSLRTRLQQAADGHMASHGLGQLHHDLGRFYARHAARVPRRSKPHLVGLHGQTIYHHPRKEKPATLQLGEPSYLAATLGVPVISNFRVADMAMGGQGAPLATAFHVQEFARRGRHVCVHNLGGISNVTSMDWRRGIKPKVLSFDTGPANLLLDIAAQHFSNGRHLYDAQGRWAARGKVNSTLLAKWLRHRFFRLPPPKSTGRETFGAHYFATLLKDIQKFKLTRFDALATLTQFTAQSILLNYRLHLKAVPDQVLLAGGGVGNSGLVRAIQEALLTLDPRLAVRTSADAGWTGQSVEPAAFAWLAWLRSQGRAGNYPATTGAKRPVLLGQITEL